MIGSRDDSEVSCISLWADYPLPVIACPPRQLPTVRRITLTELVCFKVYGAALSLDQLHELAKNSASDNIRLWGHEAGACFLASGLETIKEGGKRQQRFEMMRELAEACEQAPIARRLQLHKELLQIHPDSAALPTEYANVPDRLNSLTRIRDQVASYTAALRWLQSDHAPKRKKAIQFALDEADRVRQEAARIDEVARGVYEALSVLVQAEKGPQRVELNGVKVDLQTDKELPIKRGSTVHKTIKPTVYGRARLHHIWSNQLYPAPLEYEDEERFVEETVWRDVKLSHAHALCVLQGAGDVLPLVQTALVPTASRRGRGRPRAKGAIEAYAKKKWPDFVPGSLPTGVRPQDFRRAVQKLMKEDGVSNPPIDETFASYGY